MEDIVKVKKVDENSKQKNAMEESVKGILQATKNEETEEEKNLVKLQEERSNESKANSEKDLTSIEDKGSSDVSKIVSKDKELDTRKTEKEKEEKEPLRETESQEKEQQGHRQNKTVEGQTTELEPKPELNDQGIPIEGSKRKEKTASVKGKKEKKVKDKDNSKKTQQKQIEKDKLSKDTGVCLDEGKNFDGTEYHKDKAIEKSEIAESVRKSNAININERKQSLECKELDKTAINESEILDKNAKVVNDVQESEMQYTLEKGIKDFDGKLKSTLEEENINKNIILPEANLTQDSDGISKDGFQCSMTEEQLEEQRKESTISNKDKDRASKEETEINSRSGEAKSDMIVTNEKSMESKEEKDVRNKADKIDKQAANKRDECVETDYENSTENGKSNGSVMLDDKQKENVVSECPQKDSNKKEEVTVTKISKENDKLQKSVKKVRHTKNKDKESVNKSEQVDNIKEDVKDGKRISPSKKEISNSHTDDQGKAEGSNIFSPTEENEGKVTAGKECKDKEDTKRILKDTTEHNSEAETKHHANEEITGSAERVGDQIQPQKSEDIYKTETELTTLPQLERKEEIQNMCSTAAEKSTEAKEEKLDEATVGATEAKTDISEGVKKRKSTRKEKKPNSVERLTESKDTAEKIVSNNNLSEGENNSKLNNDVHEAKINAHITNSLAEKQRDNNVFTELDKSPSADAARKRAKSCEIYGATVNGYSVKETMGTERSSTLTESISSSTLTPGHTTRTIPDRINAAEDTSLASMEELPFDKPSSFRVRDANKGGRGEKPRFSTRLADRTAAQGSRIKLTASVLGSPEPAVSWLKDGLPLSDSAAWRATCSGGLATLELPSASPSQSGEYTCVARNANGQTSSSAELRVCAGFEPAPFPPTFTRLIKDSYKWSEDQLVLECRVRSHPPPKVTWLKGGAPLAADGRYQQEELAGGVCRLVIGSPHPEVDSGRYTCRAENLLWSDSVSADVDFPGREQLSRCRRSEATGVSTASRDQRRPQLASVLTDHVVPRGGTMALQVHVTGVPRPEVTWLRGSEPLRADESARLRLLEESGLHTLLVSGVTESEAGVYTCRAANMYGHTLTTAAVEVVPPGGTVRGGRPAQFLSRPDQDLNVAVGEDIVVSFRVGGDPRPKVTWAKGIRDLTNSQRSLKETVNDYVRLTMKRALLSDAGTYCIMAKNVYGCDRAFFTVRIRQRARSLTPVARWGNAETSTILRDIHDQMERNRRKDVPAAVCGEPTVVDSGRNWLTLSWPKSEPQSGVPVLAYRVEAWRLGEDGGARWTELGVTPINSFDAFNLKAGQQYQFRVTPRNRYGWGEPVTTTTPVLVGGCDQLPEFERILPGQLKLLRGSSVTLTCQVRGAPEPEVRWCKDNWQVYEDACPRISTAVEDGQCRLAISDVQDEDEGRYMCEATNRAGRASTFARLVVVADPRIMQADADLKRGILDDDADREIPPQFTMRLRDRRVQMTYPVRLTCQVMGNPQPEVTWSKDGQAIQPSDTHAMLSEQQFHTLELSRATLENGGQYSATARNALGAVSCRCRLVVDKGIRAYVGPEFLCDLPPELLLREGDQMHLAAHVEAYPVVGVMWYRDGVRLRPSRRAVMTLDHDGRVELTLAGVTTKDAGLYSCTATNEVGRAETSCRVRLQAAAEPHQPPHPPPPRVLAPDTPYSDVPLFVTKPRSTEAAEGDTVVVMCEVVGDPKPEVVWLRDWLKPDYYRDAPHFRRVGDGPEYRLEIPLARLDYTGAYSVIARNCHGEAKAVISLQIYAKGQGKEDKMDHSSIKHGRVQTLPVVQRGLKDLRCCDGDAVTLECRVQATPAPDVRWEKGGRLLPLGGDIVAEFDGETARLTIQQVYPEDEGEYTCVVYNELGKASTSACLVVDVPEEKDMLLSQRLARPPGLLSAGSTPRSTPRSTPSRSKSPSISRPRERNATPSGEGRQRRLRLVAPKFYAVPHNRVAEEGETVRLQCAVAGHPAPWTSWDKDGQPVTPSARLTLSEKDDDLRVLQIDEVTPEDAGLYRVTLENEVGRVEATARLEVIGRHGVTSRGLRAWSASPRSSPYFSRRLAPSTARVGGRLTLACDLRGSPSPVTSWYRDGELVVRSARATPSWDGLTARLDLESLEPEDAGVYTCAAENEAGRARCSAELKVLASDDPCDEDRRPPVVLRGLPDHLLLAEGDPAELHLLLRGTPPMDVVWTKNGVELPDCDDFRYLDHGEGRLGLRIADVFPEDEGVYRCEAFSDHGDCFTECRVDVRVPAGSSSGGGVAPQFAKEPLPVLAPVGGRACFCVRAQRVLSPEDVCWRVAGVPASSCSRFKVETQLDESVLTVEPVRAEDAGPVTCDMGDARCRTELGVTDDDDGGPPPASRLESPAVLLRGPRDTTALVGDGVVLRASYSGSPEPTVRWLRAGRELAASERVKLHAQDGVACLSLVDITADDSGKYVISVENCMGADCHFASVAVEGPPDPPAGRPSVTSCGQGSVVVTWSSPPYDGGCMLTGYSVEMSKASADPQWTVVADECNSLSHTVVDLQAEEKYLFRIRAHNVHGCSDASTESEPFVLGEVEESYGPSFEPREVRLEPGEKFRRQYEVLEELGKGRYGVVHKVCDRAAGQKFAAKFVRCIKAADRDKVHEEICVMNMLWHPKLLQLRAAFDTPRDIVMVTEYISGGELFERVVADDFTLTEKDCILFMRQICEGVEYMHQNYVVHLDLKPENIMCHTRTSHQIKLIDFGLAKKLDPDVPVRVMFGTPEFIPPEIINYEPIGLESDMWSVGVICYVLLSGLSPFMGDNDAQTFNNITRADYDFEDEAFDAISQDAKDFISSLLVNRKEKRLTASECLQHKWLTQHHDNMSCVKLSTDKLKTFIIRRKWQLSVARRQKA